MQLVKSKNQVVYFVMWIPFILARVPFSQRIENSSGNIALLCKDLAWVRGVSNVEMSVYHSPTGKRGWVHWRKYAQNCLLNLAWDYVPDSSPWQRIILLQMSIVLWNPVIDETLGLERLSNVGEDHIILNFAPLYRVWRAWIFFSNTISFMHWN